MMLKNLTPRLAERGKIKIGVKGASRKSSGGAEFQLPQKLDHFVVTTLERGPDGNFVRDDAIHALIGPKPTRIPIRLLFNDIEMNFMSRYACFVGRQMWCAGDGESAQRIGNDGRSRETVQCPCPRIDQGYEGKDKCKVNGALSIIIDGVPGVGNVWTFRTTSWNSVQNLTSAMYQIKALSGGVLAGLPIDLVLSPKEVTAPDGKMMKAWIVSMQFSGTVEELRGTGYKLLEAEATHGLRVKQVEDDVRRRLALPAPVDVPLPGDDVDDVVDEFYPDNAVSETPAPRRPTREQFKKLPAQAEQSPAAQLEDIQTFAVYDEFGDVIAEFATPEEAAGKLRAVLEGCANPREREAIIEANPDYDPGAPPAVAQPTAADQSNGRIDDPSTSGGRGGEQPEGWDAGARTKTQTHRIPLTSRGGKVRHFDTVLSWCAAFEQASRCDDPWEVWAANEVTHAALSKSAKRADSIAALKSTADRIHEHMTNSKIAENPGG